MFHTEFSFFWPFLNHSVSVSMSVGVSWMWCRFFACFICVQFYSISVQYSCDIMSMSRVKEVFHGDNKPLSYSLRNNPSIQSVPSSSLLLLSCGREGGPVPDLYLVCSSSMALCGCYHPLPTAKPPAAHSGSVTWHSHSTAPSQSSPVTRSSLTCVHSDVHQGRLVFLHCSQRNWRVRLWGQSVASWRPASFGGSVSGAHTCVCRCVFGDDSEFQTTVWENVKLTIKTLITRDSPVWSRFHKKTAVTYVACLCLCGHIGDDDSLSPNILQF